MLYAFGAVPPLFAIGQGTYAGLLGVNVYGLLLCTGLYLLPVGIKALLMRRRETPFSFQEIRR